MTSIGTIAGILTGQDARQARVLASPNPRGRGAALRCSSTHVRSLRLRRSLARGYTRDLDPEIRDPMLYLFISSPHSTTPFHVDRYITFLMQITGNKKLFVWPASDRETVSEEALETLFADPSQRSPLLPPSREEYCTEHSLSPGECLHIPFTAPHWVKNGDEVSISLSIIFRTRRTDRLRNAYQLNYGLRRRLGWAPFPVGQSPLRDHSKDLLLRTYSTLRTSQRRVMSSVRAVF